MSESLTSINLVFSPNSSFSVIRSMILEWHIEYFIDCLYALWWPPRHANFSSQKRLRVTLNQAARRDAPRTFPVNKLLRGGGDAEQRWAGKNTHVHTSPSWERPYKNHERAQWDEASLNLLLSHSLAASGCSYWTLSGHITALCAQIKSSASTSC